MQSESTEREVQLRSVDQAEMDYWVNQVRNGYREMTAIALRAIQGEENMDVEMSQPLGEEAESLHDQEVVWPLDAEKECCYRKDGGHVVVRSR
ncbi:hypothetical protein [Desmospora activa]|uniref:Uncharacterized protein n=1 Tax=Desmospora activa DSM 45169 TaxID=1121389 RepID=A0A2T4ZD78_9BACL|nr:hypothetical protein [Desmospora activa]PTM59845.1 hypothetical protein C8J48_2480 [Desmospora activa DSM 45169]